MSVRYQVGRLVTPDGATIEYVETGAGTPVLLIPGAGDGVRTVGQFPYAGIVARMYKNWAKTHRMVIISRRQPVPAGFSYQQFAEDFIWAMDQLGMERAHIETNSAGGPVGQWMAYKHPERVLSLVLGETFAHMDEPFQEIIRQWIHWAQIGDWPSFHKDSIEKTYAPAKLKTYRLFYPFLKLLGHPKDPSRLVHILEGLLTIDNRPILPTLTCPTLVIGGDVDVLTRPELQKEMVDLIPNARQVVVPGTGHGQNTEKPKEHEAAVLAFYRQVEEELGVMPVVPN